MPARPTPNSARRIVGLVAGLLLFVGAGVAFAPSAAAVDDITRPDYRVTQGPSCQPGGVRIEVVAGTVAYHVVLATTRQPDGEDAADLAPGEAVQLSTGDVAWGETIDSRLEFTALDGSGVTFSDDLVPYSFTRPAEEDCAAIAAETAPSTPVDVQVTEAEAPVAPVTRDPVWPAVVAGASLVGAAGGLALVSARRSRRSGPTVGA